MSFDKFVYRSQLTAQCLDQIVSIGGASSIFAPSSEHSPQVRELLAAQERLLSAAESLLESCGTQAVA